MPPVWKVASLGGQNNKPTAPDDYIVPAESGKMYVIQGVVLMGKNTAGTAGSYLSLSWLDFWTDAERILSVYPDPSVVNTKQEVFLPLNIPTKPGTGIRLYADDNFSIWNCRLFYTEANLS